MIAGLQMRSLLSPPRIALAEDDPGLRDVVAETLRDQGLDVIEAGDGGALMGVLRLGGVAAVVTDLMMPGLRGDDVLRLLRNGGDRTPFVVITAASPAVIDAVLLSSNVTVLRKPFTIEALIAAVTSVVDGHAPVASSNQVAEAIRVAAEPPHDHDDDCDGDPTVD
jgi:DNA-binding response OmpR family regulator